VNALVAILKMAIPAGQDHAQSGILETRLNVRVNVLVNDNLWPLPLRHDFTVAA
jgi:hypothetical protein